MKKAVGGLTGLSTSRRSTCKQWRTVAARFHRARASDRYPGEKPPLRSQLFSAKRHLPKGYSRELPRLAHGPSARLPRVYDLAFEAIAHGDGRVDVESLSRFVMAYQTVAPLKLGELWALPIMLRLALIENWIFCSDAGFRGECRTFGPGDYASLPGMNDRISSGRMISNDYPYADKPDWQRGGWNRQSQSQSDRSN
jgi:hypothetical protein